MARWIAPRSAGQRPIVVGSSIAEFQKRMYASARSSRLTAGWMTSNSSADSELATSVTALRSRARQLVRDASYAKRAKVIVVNNVVGSGIGLQAQVMTTRDDLNDRVNDDIEAVWERWARGNSCHTGGTLHFADLERAAMGGVFEAGEVLIRKHYRPFGDSDVPFALELIEPERLADEFISPTGPMTPLPGNLFRMGIEVDQFFRPVAYFLRPRHLGEIFVGEKVDSSVERVPAEQIIHLRVIDRWPQTRGEPWLHAVIRKLNDMDGYSEAEIIAARGAASYMGWIETPEGTESVEGSEQTDGSQELELSPGLFAKGAPGEKMTFFSPNRPNTALDPFMRYMLREVAAGVGVSYESLSRDYSQSNYSSSRLALLDDRDLWRTLQLWFIRSFREQVHGEWLRQAVFAGAIASVPVVQYAADPRKYEKVKFKPRGWSWIDPQKEVEARKMAVRCGFDTMTNVISETANGRDLEDIMRERQRELKMAKSFDLEYDTDVLEVMPAETTPTPSSSQDQPTETLTAGTQQQKRAAVMRELGEILNQAELRGELRGRSDSTAEAIAAIARAVEDRPPSVVNVAGPQIRVEPAPAPVVNVAAPTVNVEAARTPSVHIAPPNISVAAPTINVEAPPAPAVIVEPARAPNVYVAPAQVNVGVSRGETKKKKFEVVERDAEGFATKYVQTEGD